MRKKYFILNTDKRGSGVAKLDIINGKPSINFEINNYMPLHKNEVFKGYIFNGNQFCFIGSMENCKESFNIDKNLAVEGVVVVRKNLDSNKGELEFWAGNEIKILAENEFTNPPVQAAEAAYNDSTSSQLKNEEIAVMEPVIENITEQENKNNLPDVFTFDNFFGGGFEWQRVSGYFCMYNYSIMQHIMSGRKIYETINYFGYYYSGIKEGDDIKYIATAIPSRTGYSCPFRDCDEYVYTIEDDRYSYYVICVGIDKKGEFFVEL